MNFMGCNVVFIFELSLIRETFKRNGNRIGDDSRGKGILYMFMNEYNKYWGRTVPGPVVSLFDTHAILYS